MEVPALAVGGAAPVLPPLLILFLIMTVIGLFMVVAALLRRNIRLVTQQGLKPWRAGDLHKAADPSLSTRGAGSRPFADTAYARLAMALLVIGGTGILAMGLWGLFGG